MGKPVTTTRRLGDLSDSSSSHKRREKRRKKRREKREKERRRTSTTTTTASSSMTSTTSVPQETRAESAEQKQTTTSPPVFAANVSITREQYRAMRQCTATGCGSMVYENENAMTSKGLRCSRHRQVRCCVDGCTNGAYGKVERPADHFGARGLRCVRHGGGKVCNVRGCITLCGQRRVFIEDLYGGVGQRCEAHNGKLPEAAAGLESKKRTKVVTGSTTTTTTATNAGVTHEGTAGDGTTPSVKGKKSSRSDAGAPASSSCTTTKAPRAKGSAATRENRGGRFGYFCSAVDCNRLGKKKIPFEDAFGPAGLRCTRHGASARCEISDPRGCDHFPRGRVMVADKWGDGETLRCFMHGGRTRCSVNGCKENAAGRADEADVYGRAGTRCATHNATWESIMEWKVAEREMLAMQAN